MEPIQDFVDFEDGAIDNCDETNLQFNETIEPQPRSTPISHERLTKEVRGIYAGLQMSEQKCIQVINESWQAQTYDKVENHWRALISLHRTVLHEYHDFLITSQHRSASDDLHALASKYDIPARMWKFGIYNLLEYLRHKLPDSYEHILAFLILALQMVGLLYEVVPAFDQNWMECLGDLYRYQMAIDQGDLKDQEVWAQAARYWYFKVADERPYTGRLLHHLAILSRTEPIQQLMLYSCALTAKIPFSGAKISINTLLDSVIEHLKTSSQTPGPELMFICLITQLYRKEDYGSTLVLYVRALPSHVEKLSLYYRKQAAHTAIVSICSCSWFGSKDSVLRQAMLQHWSLTSSDWQATRNDLESSPEKARNQLRQPLEIWTTVMEALLKEAKSYPEAITPYIYVSLAFVVSLAKLPSAFSCILDALPWSSIVLFLNNRYETTQAVSGTDLRESPIVCKEETPLPEDYSLRALSLPLFPDNYPDASADQVERNRETDETTKVRNQRVLRAGLFLAQKDTWLNFDPETGFETVTRVDQDTVLLNMSTS